MDDPPWFALPRCALSSVRIYSDDPQLFELMSLVFGTPALRSRLAEKVEEWRQVFEGITAEHLGCRSTDMLASLVTYAVIGGARAATGVWVRTGGTSDLVDFLDEALAFMRRGCGSLQLSAAQVDGGPARVAGT